MLCETSEDGEGWGETLVRGIKEELGVDYIYQPTLFSIGKKDGYLGETIFVEGVLARGDSYSFYWSNRFICSRDRLGRSKSCRLGSSS